MTQHKTALITGAAKGIGRQTALSMAKAGYHIAVNYRSDPGAAQDICQTARQWGVRAECFYADLGRMEDLQSMFEEVDRVFPRLDVLVNNAGISSEAYFLDVTEEFFDAMTAVDWKGLFFCSQLAAKRMIRTGTKGVIINLASNQIDGCWPRATVYAPTKAAVNKFTKNAAMELVPYGIRMVAVAPGYTDVGWEPGDIRLEAAKRLPMRRFASTEEIAQGILYLASDAAAYITGTTLTIDGGATLPVVAANDFVE